jgi:hypothetical protein
MKNQYEKTPPSGPINIDDSIQAIVVWADNTQDHEKDCSICYTQTCVMPVHREQYKIVMDKDAKVWEDENPVI